MWNFGRTEQKGEKCGKGDCPLFHVFVIFVGVLMLLRYV
jgi:hypothetical protein